MCLISAKNENKKSHASVPLSAKNVAKYIYPSEELIRFATSCHIYPKIAEIRIKYPNHSVHRSAWDACSVMRQKMPSIVCLEHSKRVYSAIYKRIVYGVWHKRMPYGTPWRTMYLQHRMYIEWHKVYIWIRYNVNMYDVWNTCIRHTTYICTAFDVHVYAMQWAFEEN
jgi:hypothetical protein